MATGTGSNIEIVDAGRLNRFPLGAAHAGFPELDEWSEVARTHAVSSVTWAETGARVDPMTLSSTYFECAGAIAARPAEVTGHVRGHDGIDMIVQHDALDARRHRALLDDGGGLVLSEAERFSDLLNRMCGELSVAWNTRVTAHALVGSEPTRVLGPQVVRTCVIAVSASVVVHPHDGAPFDLPAGGCAVVDGFPRVLASPEAFTLLFVESTFTAAAQHALLLERAQFHPLLRIDAPIDPASPVEVYGLDGEVAYADVLERELATLVEHSTEEQLRWWWVLDRSLPPLPIPFTGDDIVVRGRFPGGVGVVHEGEELVLKGAGVVFAVPAGRQQLLQALLSGSPIGCSPRSELFPSLANLAAVGAAEVLP
jgi:hypothetical protein